MKITNQTQRLIKVGTVIILPNDTAEVDGTLDQYPALVGFAERGDILIVDEKTNNKSTKKATVKEDE